MSTRFCLYCRREKPDVGFKMIFNPKKLNLSAQCPGCQEVRKKPREQLEREAKEASQMRARISKEESRRIADERRKQ